MQLQTFLEHLRTLCSSHPIGTHPTENLLQIARFWKQHAHSFPYDTRVLARSYIEQHLGGDIPLLQLIARGEIPLVQACIHAQQHPQHIPFLLQRLHIDPIHTPSYTHYEHIRPRPNINPPHITHIPYPPDLFNTWALQHIQRLFETHAIGSAAWDDLVPKVRDALTGHAPDDIVEELRRFLEEPGQTSCCAGCFYLGFQSTRPFDRVLIEGYHFAVHALSNLLYTSTVPNIYGWVRYSSTPKHHRARVFSCIVNINVGLSLQHYPSSTSLDPHTEHNHRWSTVKGTTHATQHRLSIEFATLALQETYRTHLQTSKPTPQPKTNHTPTPCVSTPNPLHTTRTP